MTLSEFAQHQEEVVRKRASMVRMMTRLRPDWDLEAGIQKELRCISELKGVSFREFLNEVLFPGSFYNTPEVPFVLEDLGVKFKEKQEIQ